MLKKTFQNKMEAIRRKATDFSLNKSGTVGVEPTGRRIAPGLVEKRVDVKFGKLGGFSVPTGKLQYKKPMKLMKKSLIKAVPKKIPKLLLKKKLKDPKSFSNGIGVGGN